ncbi:hypothetical protein EDB87DRAFT_1578936 [Lactarius vividus]|nr:hypothetical protein EDB87DRAFT_1578936 [Lactarius vividus]
MTPNPSSAVPPAGNPRSGRRPTGGVTLSQVSDLAPGKPKTPVIPPLTARDPLHGRIPCIYDGNYPGALPMTGTQQCRDKVDKWKKNWTERLSKVRISHESAPESDKLWASFVKDFEHSFARKRKLYGSQTWIRSLCAEEKKPKARKPKAVDAQSTRDLVDMDGVPFAKSYLGYPSAPKTPSIPPQPTIPTVSLPPPSAAFVAPTPPAVAVAAPVVPAAPAPIPSWPGLNTFANPVLPDSMWTGPITFARAIQMKRGQCFKCNKKGHMMSTCQADGQPDKKAPSNKGTRKNKSPTLEPVPPPGDGRPTTTVLTPALAEAFVEALDDDNDDPLPLNQLVPYFTPLELDVLDTADRMPVELRRALTGALLRRSRALLARGSTVESGDSRREGGVMLRSRDPEAVWAAAHARLAEAGLTVTRDEAVRGTLDRVQRVLDSMTS